MSAALRLPLALRFALRSLRGGLSGFGVFLGCLALGVGAIVAVNSLSASLKDALAREGAAILGGDLSLELAQRAPNAAEEALVAAAAGPGAKISRIVQMRAMARAASGEAAMVEIKAVDASWPLAGEAELEPPGELASALAREGDAFAVVADPALPVRLGLKPGESFAIGVGRYKIAAALSREPDQLASGFGLGPRVLMSRAALEASGLLRPGALARFLTRVKLAPGASDADLDALAAQLREKAPDAGWEIRTRRNVSPQFERNLDRFTQFLTLIGLSSLIVGGVGVANAVRAHALKRRPTLATLKTLGASGGFVFAATLAEVMLVALIGVVAGAALGAALPALALALFGGLLPFPLAPALHPAAIGEGILYGLLTALAFSIAPLGRAHDTPAQAIFRDDVEPARARLRLKYLLLTLGAGALLVGAALALSADRRITLIYLAATLAVFALMRLVAFALTLAARHAPAARAPLTLRLALAGVRRPGALTGSIVLSLGLGLSLAVALALVDASIRADLGERRAQEAPSFFFLDVPGARGQEFADELRARAPGASVELAPMLRGRIVRLKGEPAEAVKPGEDAAWALQGDRGLTFAQEIPPGSTLVSGQWWPQDYAGPPLVSMEERVARGLRLAVGDEISVNVLGRTVSARIANLRKVDWRGMGINFVLVFSPNAFAGAPYNMLATLTLPRGESSAREAAEETALLRALAAGWPSVASVRVREALETAATLAGKLSAAVRGASSVAIAAAILVLAGAVLAQQSARVREGAILKTLGATRARLLAAALVEHALTGTAAALAGALCGTLIAFAATRLAMDVGFAFSLGLTLAAAFGALALAALVGLLGAARALSRKPAPLLREL